jgi:hypothetical protein
MFRALMAPDGFEPDAAAFQRVFVFTAISTTAARIDTPEHDLLLSRLARKHTVGYLPGPGYTQVFGVVANVRASAMPEGVALIVSTASGGEFSAGYLTHSVPRVYLPAALASLHEHALLRRLDNVLIAMPSEETDQRLTALRHSLHELLRFRLDYRLHAISQISMHNDFHSHLRSALSLDGSLERLSDDLRLVEGDLGADLHERDEKRRLGLTALGSGVGAFAAIHEFFEIGLRLKWDQEIARGMALFLADKTYLPHYENMLSQRHLDELWGLGVPAAIAILVALVSRRMKWTFPHH